MKKDYADVEHNTIADYTVALRETENKIIESLRARDLKAVYDYIKLYFQLCQLHDKKSRMVARENSRRPRS